MSDSQENAASAAEATQEPAKATEGPKSTDTGTLKNFSKEPSHFDAQKAKADTQTPEPKEESEEEAKATQQEPHGEAGDNEDAPSADDSGKKKDRLPRWVKERMERVRRVTEAETRERVLAELQARQKSKKPEPPHQEAAPTTDKTLEDFDWDQDAYLAYKVESEVTKREQQRERIEVERKQAEAAEKFKSKIDAFEKKVGDGAWEDIESAPLNTDPRFKPIVDLFLGDDHDLEIAHHLVMNPEEANNLLTLSPLARVRELAKLADTFSGSPAKKPAAQAPKKITNAPPPPKTVQGSGKSEVTEDDPEISPEQRIALWKAKRKR